LGLKLVLEKTEAVAQLNKLGNTKQAFSFYCDFLGEKWCIEANVSGNTRQPFRLEIDRTDLRVRIPKSKAQSQKLEFRRHPIGYEEFKKAFDQVVNEINFGNSFLANLTFQTPIETNLSLEEIFNSSKAKYRLLVPGQFVVFSPETFVKIEKDRIYSYPMKGTIDANIPRAKEAILKDQKELAEHITIVDLIRNDLSQVADDITVSKFRYLDEIKTNHKHLLQVSSEVSGNLPPNWEKNIGSILSNLLPAGSISGAPKPETIRIIQQTENYQRGFYTGICGHFDGASLDTGVMIRFIKKQGDQYYFCSGGGITSFSDAWKEYQEMIDKIYLAF